jgi:EAL domain-containing protein (putative c-di-GMP-specific phosphodiesterase class I)
VQLADQAGTVHQALGCALQALDRAKQRRHDCFMSYEPSPHHETARRRKIKIADDVMSALKENRMVLALQPIVHANSGKTTLYECLLRMERPNGSWFSAGDFISIAEQVGLSRLIDRRALELAVDLIKNHPRLKLSLNVSSLTASDHEWLVSLHRLTGGRHALIERLTIEITETATIDDLDHTITFVDTLKKLGCRVAIDDFGAGYSSFKNLKLLDVDMVKIDGSFIENLATDKHDRVFIKTLKDLTDTFELETVAEWVGDAMTVAILKEIGITYLQGYYFGEPVLAADFQCDAAS